MNQKKKSFSELRSELSEKLQALGCSHVTVTGYQYIFNSVESALRSKGHDSYTEQAGRELLDRYLKDHGENDYYHNLRTVISRLNDLLIGEWHYKHSDTSKKFHVPEKFQSVAEEYLLGKKHIGLKEGTIKIKRYAVSWFLDELSKHGCIRPDEISAELTGLACMAVTDRNLWNEVRQFLRFISDAGYTNTDYSTVVPHHAKPYVLPSVYTVGEIRRIEDSVDRSTVTGKRDYAMILLASRMGLRSGDIASLRMCDISNPSSGLNIIQQKTGKELHLPFIQDVSEAIKEYLEVRPNVGMDGVFLTINAPYHRITTGVIRAKLSEYIKLSGVTIGERKHGPHSLRASLASSMVNDSVTYETVRKILGHSSENAIKHYARIDIEKLRNCSLTPPEAMGAFKNFLDGEVRTDA